MKISKILVPTRGRGSDDDAITLACRLAKKDKGKVFVIYIIEVDRTLPLDADVEPEVLKGEDALDHAEQVAKDQDCPITTELLQARETGPAVVDEAIERNADLIIVGAPYKNRYGQFELGPTASYILKNAPCRVWVCREPAGK